MVTTKLNLSMTEPQVRQIYAKQGDTGRVLDISLDQTPEDGTLRILRPDGVEVTSDAVTGGEVESGSSFDSLTEADVTELTVGIEPVQDLNGYDKPWVGGAEVNLFMPPVTSTNSGITYTLNADGSVTVNGTSTAYSVVYQTVTLKAGTYRLTGGQGAVALQVQENGTTIAQSNAQYPNAGFTLNADTEVRMRLAVPTVGTTVSNLVIYPMLAVGSVVPTSWSPYSNICPITGHDEVRVTRTGINVWDEEWEVGSISGTGSNQNANDRIRSKNYISVVPNATYFYHINSTYGIFTWGYDANKNYVGRVPSNGYAISNNTVTIPTNVCYIRFVVQPGYGTTYNNDISINYPSADHDYHAYQGSTYTTSLGQTVYGGTLDMVSGVLTVDRAYQSLSGSDIYGVAAEGGGYRLTLVSAQDRPATTDIPYAISNKYVFVPDYTTALRTNGSFTFSANRVNMLIRDNSLISPSDVIDSLNAVPLQMVYTNFEPVEYQLTPQQIKTLVGTNNVWASSGDIVNITFTYGGLLSELPSEATEIVGKCYCDVEQNGVSSMPFTLNVKKNERES